MLCNAPTATDAPPDIYKSMIAHTLRHLITHVDSCSLKVGATLLVVLWGWGGVDLGK